jgi:hypothetical protein
MDEKVGVLMAAIRAIVDGWGGSWREKRDAVLTKIDPDDAEVFWNFIRCFNEDY